MTDGLPTAAGLDAWLAGYAACARYSDPSVCGETALFTLILRWMRQNPGLPIPGLDLELVGSTDRREVLRTVLAARDAALMH